jgi:hypothetical protein
MSGSRTHPPSPLAGDRLLRCCGASLVVPSDPVRRRRIRRGKTRGLQIDGAGTGPNIEAFTNQDDEAARAMTHEAKPFTPKQGQYLAFIYYYTKIHGRAPAQADLQRFFRVTPPVVHQMIKTLAARRFIEREPGTARSIRLRLTRAQLPDLE